MGKYLSLAKLVLGRMCGIKYGGVLFNGTKEVRMVRTAKLRKIRELALKNCGAGNSMADTNVATYDEVIRLTNGLRRTSSAPAYHAGMSYSNSGALRHLQVYDNVNNESVITLVDHVKHPIKTFLRNA